MLKIMLAQKQSLSLRSNNKTMVDLQKNRQQEHMDTKEHLNSLYAKNGTAKQG